LNTSQIQALTTAQTVALSTASVAALRDAQIEALSTANVAALTTRQVAALSTAGIAALTTAGARAMGANAIAALTTAQISAVETVDLAALTTAQVAALSSAQASKLTSAQIVALTSAQIPALSAGALAALSTAQIQIAAMGTAQIAALLTSQVQALTSSQMAGLSTADIAALGTAQIDAMQTANVAALSALQIAALRAAQVASLNTSQIQALTTDQAAFLTGSGIAQWTASQVIAFDPADVAMLRTEQVNALRTDQLAAFTTGQVRSLSTAVLGTMRTAQTAALTSVQVATLTTSQIRALTASGVASLKVPEAIEIADAAALKANQVSGLTTAQLAAMSTTQISVLNSAPVAADDRATAVETGGRNNALLGSDATGNVLTNDTSVNTALEKSVTTVRLGAIEGQGNPKPVGIAFEGNYGSLTLNANGAFVYKVNNSNPTVQGLGPTSSALVDSFNYTVLIGGSQDTAVLNVSIRGANDATVAVIDAAAATESGAGPGDNASGNVLANDIDLDIVSEKKISAVRTGSSLGSGASGTLDAASNSLRLQGSYGVLTLNIDGSYSYAIDNTNATVQALDAGSAALIDNFNYDLTDGGLIDTALLAISIHGANDTPVFLSGNLTRTLFEPLAPTGDLSAIGTIGFNDVDLRDTHSVSVTGSAGALGDLVVQIGTDTTGSGLGGVIGWTYRVAASAVDYLAKDQKLTETFIVSLSNGSDAPITRTVSVAITGTNDAPVIQASDLTGSITEQLVATGNLIETGTILFDDADLSDLHSVRVVGSSAAPLGALTIRVDSDSTGIGPEGVLVWDYRLAASAVEYLAKDQTRIETFDIALDDAQGDSVMRTVSVTIVGTNDIPTISAVDVLGTVVEGSVLSDSGHVTFSDPDLSDHPIVSWKVASINALKADGTSDLALTEEQKQSIERAFTVSIPIANTSKGTVNWGYAINETHLDFLGRSEVVQAVFTLSVDDFQGGIAEQVVTVTIYGTNDAPRLGRISLDGVEDSAVSLSAANFQAAYADFEGSALATITLSSLPESGILKLGDKPVTLHQVIPTADLDGLRYEPSANESGPKTFNVTAFDGALFSTDTLVTINLAAVNDAPVLGALSVIGAEDTPVVFTAANFNGV
ncbi:MAG: hypothetical protein EBY24_20460, partial [Betaproteobacteria bacterium]|nr:hypothetical protein [Betaproteobacteria bacterium]